jgi:predicted transcriptional regulator of viral defense system
MSDTPKVDHDRIYRTAESQAGYFTRSQALASGMDGSTLQYHARPDGRYERVRRGLYRLRQFPTSSHEHVVAAWLPLQDAGAVVSHESALELYELSDVIPAAVHISLPRAKRGQRPRPGVRLHTLKHALKPTEVRTVHGMKVTTPDRAIVESFEDGTQAEQVELAVQQAIQRGVTSAKRLRNCASRRSERSRRFIEEAINRSGA